MRYFIESTSQWVEAESIQGRLWVHLNGRTFVLDESPSRASRRSASETSSETQLMAPMPGKITKILATADQLVKKGDPVLVMEAMKMEYTIKASADGKVVSLSCQVGDQVKMGQKLVELQKP